MEKRQWIHTPPTYLLAERALTLQVILPDEAPRKPQVSLIYTVKGSAYGEVYKVAMHAAHTYAAPTGGFVVYACEIPAKHMRGTEIHYHFSVDGSDGEEYEYPLQKLPKLPPLVVTEIVAWAGMLCKYIELANLTDKRLDLFDYELLMQRDSGEFGRNPLADRRGVNVIPPHGVAAVRFIDPAVLAADGKTPDTLAVLDRFAEQYPTACGNLPTRDIRLFHATTAEMGADGQAHFKKDCFDLYQKYYGRVLGLVPRGGKLSDAFFEMEISRTKERRDIRCDAAQQWRFDLFAAKKGIITTNLAPLTPGFLSAAQTLVDTRETAVPAILPIAPEGKHYLSEGDLTLHFAAFGGGVAGEATVYLLEEGSYKPRQAKLQQDGTFRAKIRYEKLSCMQGKLRYYIEVRGSLFTARLGSPEEPLTVTLTDNRGPDVTARYPAIGEVLENDFTPEIRISYYDVSGVDRKTSQIHLDGINVSEGAIFTAEGVTYRPQKKLALGKHMVELSLRDKLGNRSYEKYEFEISDGKELKLFCGQVHAHTAESDGAGTPTEAIRHARHVARMDYFAVTDHTHYMEEVDYRRQRRIADKYNAPGEFVTLYGFEMTWNNANGYFGHTNLLGTDWINLYPMSTDLAAYYRQVAADPKAIAMFNHPDDLWGNMNELAWQGEEIAERYCLAEINGARYDAYYALALSRGWRVAPLYNEDNHARDWGDSGAMGYVLAPSLTRENVMNAMRRRRTYSTTDRSMKVYYRVNGVWLGTVLDNPEKLLVEVDITTAREEGIGKIELMTEDNIVMATVDAGALTSFSWSVEINPDFDYYYLRITGDDAYTVTAPVFVTGRDLLNVKRMTYGVADSGEYPHVVTATVKNESDKPMLDVEIDLYLTAPTGFALRTLAPFETVHLGKLAPGEQRTVTRRLPELAGRHRVTAVVAGLLGKQRYADISYVLISPICITKLMPLTSPVKKGARTVANPYPYIELYNPTARTLKLDGYRLAHWHTIGSYPDAAHTLPLDGVTVPPASTLTVWVRPQGAGLTAADFNAHYGTKLLEGEDLLITEVPLLLPDQNGKRLDLLQGEELLSRVTYGYYCTHKTDVVADVPLYYRHGPDMTATERLLTPKAGEGGNAPGRVISGQIPKIMKGLPRPSEALEAERSAERERVITRLTKASLVPFRAASFVATAVSAVKGLFDTKE
ncbi:MAG: CehA/McbA family metallohydrolase [Clostridia bacterium]|nr:CehA/McbA family metallohydrolase [Clostridia bacterium]